MIKYNNNNNKEKNNNFKGKYNKQKSTKNWNDKNNNYKQNNQYKKNKDYIKKDNNYNSQGDFKKNQYKKKNYYSQNNQYKKDNDLKKNNYYKKNKDINKKSKTMYRHPLYSKNFISRSNRPRLSPKVFKQRKTIVKVIRLLPPMTQLKLGLIIKYNIKTPFTGEQDPVTMSERLKERHQYIKKVIRRRTLGLIRRKKLRRLKKSIYTVPLTKRIKLIALLEKRRKKRLTKVIKPYYHYEKYVSSQALRAKIRNSIKRKNQRLRNQRLKKRKLIKTKGLKSKKLKEKKKIKKKLNINFKSTKTFKNQKKINNKYKFKKRKLLKPLRVVQQLNEILEWYRYDDQISFSSSPRMPVYNILFRKLKWKKKKIYTPKKFAKIKYFGKLGRINFFKTINYFTKKKYWRKNKRHYRFRTYPDFVFDLPPFTSFNNKAFFKKNNRFNKFRFKRRFGEFEIPMEEFIFLGIQRKQNISKLLFFPKKKKADIKFFKKFNKSLKNYFKNKNKTWNSTMASLNLFSLRVRNLKSKFKDREYVLKKKIEKNLIKSKKFKTRLSFLKGRLLDYNYSNQIKKNTKKLIIKSLKAIKLLKKNSSTINIKKSMFKQYQNLILIQRLQSKFYKDNIELTDKELKSLKNLARKKVITLINKSKWKYTKKRHKNRKYYKVILKKKNSLTKSYSKELVNSQHMIQNDLFDLEEKEAFDGHANLKQYLYSKKLLINKEKNTKKLKTSELNARIDYCLTRIANLKIINKKKRQALNKKNKKKVIIKKVNLIRKTKLKKKNERKQRVLSTINAKKKLIKTNNNIKFIINKQGDFRTLSKLRKIQLDSARAKFNKPQRFFNKNKSKFINKKKKSNNKPKRKKKSKRKRGGYGLQRKKRRKLLKVQNILRPKSLTALQFRQYLKRCSIRRIFFSRFEKKQLNSKTKIFKRNFSDLNKKEINNLLLNKQIAKNIAIQIVRNLKNYKLKELKNKKRTLYISKVYKNFILEYISKYYRIQNNTTILSKYVKKNILRKKILRNIKKINNKYILKLIKGNNVEKKVNLLIKIANLKNKQKIKQLLLNLVRQKKIKKIKNKKGKEIKDFNIVKGIKIFNAISNRNNKRKEIKTIWNLKKVTRTRITQIKKVYNDKKQKQLYLYKHKRLSIKRGRKVTKKIIKRHKLGIKNGEAIKKGLIKASYYYYYRRLRYDRILLDKLNYRSREIKLERKKKIKLCKILLYTLMRVYVRRSRMLMTSAKEAVKEILKRKKIIITVKRTREKRLKRLLKRVRRKIRMKRLNIKRKKKKKLKTKFYMFKGEKKMKRHRTKFLKKLLRLKEKKRKASKANMGAVRKKVIIKVIIKLLRSLLQSSKTTKELASRNKLKEIIKLFLFPLLLTKKQIEKTRLRKKNKIYLLMSQIFLYNIKQIVQSQNYSINFFGIIGSNLTAEFIMRRIKERMDQIKQGSGFKVVPRIMSMVMNSKHVVGFKFKYSGRLTGNSMAQKQVIQRGRVGNSSMRIYIDFAQDEILRKHGKCGMKLWVVRNVLTYMPYKYVYTYNYKN